jgi:hypothetical protein
MPEFTPQQHSTIPVINPQITQADTINLFLTDFTSTILDTKSNEINEATKLVCSSDLFRLGLFYTEKIMKFLSTKENKLKFYPVSEITTHMFKSYKSPTSVPDNSIIMSNLITEVIERLKLVSSFVFDVEVDGFRLKSNNFVPDYFDTSKSNNNVKIKSFTTNQSVSLNIEHSLPLQMTPQTTPQTDTTVEKSLTKAESTWLDVVVNYLSRSDLRELGCKLSHIKSSVHTLVSILKAKALLALDKRIEKSGKMYRLVCGTSAPAAVVDTSDANIAATYGDIMTHGAAKHYIKYSSQVNDIDSLAVQWLESEYLHWCAEIKKSNKRKKPFNFGTILYYYKTAKNGLCDNLTDNKCLRWLRCKIKEDTRFVLETTPDNKTVITMAKPVPAAASLAPGIL